MLLLKLLQEIIDILMYIHLYNAMNSWVQIEQGKQANIITMNLILFIFVFMPYT